MADKNKLQVKYIPIDKLKPYENNSRRHTDWQIEKVAKSIREFGWTNPILIDAKNTVIAGHARLEAAKQMDMEEVPCVQLDDMSEAQRKAYIIADNKLALDADWDPDILKLEFEALRDMDFDLELTGFEADEMASILYGSDLKEPQGREEMVPGADSNVIARVSIPGSVWLGKREEINEVFEKMKKAYLCIVSVEE